MDEFPLKMFSSDAAPQQSSAGNNGGFDCNICLDFAVDPVVTLCGHLYCWPCIYKWLHMEGRIPPKSCPVCKATLSDDSLVPLYGRGTPAKRYQQAPAIPRRPPNHQHHRHLHPHLGHGDELLSSSLPPPRRMVSSATVGVLGEMVVAVLPWVFRNHPVAAGMTGGLYYSSPYQQAVGGGLRLRREEMQVERWLNQIWMFLFCFAIFCFLLF
ncbi:hypothetical protein KFK09_009878 [Dendrobium nobile]|uniref:E3 ubiquitin-protein ligase RMA n=1 Tax=Dendrobium nobile TaxID=94219 RepID=A0A8T3BIB0_DENNO|nr:hypothetical protein KFK09_009878 [Dendrobium nobile]